MTIVDYASTIAEFGFVLKSTDTNGAYSTSSMPSNPAFLNASLTSSTDTFFLNQQLN